MSCGSTCYYRFFVCKISRDNNASMKLHLFTPSVCDSFTFKRLAHKNAFANRKFNTLEQETYVVSVFCKLSSLNSS